MINQNKIKQVILESFEKEPEQSISRLIENTSLARRTAQLYINELIEENKLKAFGDGRSRYYQRVYRNEETLEKLVVLKNGLHVGTLIFGNGHYNFQYAKGMEDALEGIEVENNTTSDLYPLFENLIPEHHRRDKLLKGMNELGSILVELNNAHGDFKFIPFEELFKYKSPVEKRPSWIENKNKILGENEYPNLLNLPIKISDEILDDISNKEHSNLSGYQHKIDVDIKGEEIIESSKNAEYLLKPLNRTLTNYFERNELNQKRYYPFLALNEHLFMSFAKNELKLDVPMSGILPAKKGDYHYIVKRYDRFDQFAYGQYDMAQLLSIHSDNKYKTTTEEVLTLFTKKTLNSSTREDMLAFQVYSSLIKHSDFHAKNIGVMEVGRKKYIGTPLYDVISVGVYNGDAEDLGLPLSRDKRKTSKYNFEDMLLISKFLDLPIMRAKEIIKKTIETYLDKFPSYIEKTRNFEKKHELQMQYTRRGTKIFSERLQSLYDNKLIELKKLGVLQELGVIEKYGGVLQREQKSLVLQKNKNKDVT